MFRPSARLAFAPLLTALLLAPKGALEGQLTEGILSPAGRLRLEVSPTFDLWSNRFGVRTEGGTVIEEVEPLGFDLERFPIPIASLQQSLRAALGDPSLTLAVGSARAVLSRDRTRIAFGAALGVFDWLTIGASVPIVKARTEIAFDYRAGGASVGANPLIAENGRVLGFIGELTSSRAALQAQVNQRCPAAPDCAVLTDLLVRYTSFTNGLTAAYQNPSPLFVTATSAAGVALQQRLTTLRAEVAQRAPSVVVPATAPMAAATLDQKTLAELLADRDDFQLIQPLELARDLWKLGDVELTLALRLLEGAVRDSADAPPAFRYLLGVQGLARLPTGKIDNPDIPLDFGSGDGQLDLEGGAFTDLRWTRVGVRAEARYGVQQKTDLVRRIAPPDVIFATASSRALVTWTPGSYLSLETAPSWYLADEFAVGATYRLWSKQGDEYVLAGPALDEGGFDPSLLEQETEETLHEVGLGFAFSTITSWREGRASVPFEVRLAVRRGVAGSGGQVPKGTRMEATGRVFWRLWGDEPEPAPSTPAP
jgi:hypothetical protein